jgi:multiple sugar transport system substrate-binding protein
MRIRSLNRRQFIKAAAFGFTSVAAASCATPVAPSPPTAAPAATQAETAATSAPAQKQVRGEIEFGYYNWGPASIQYFKDMAAAFEQQHPGTTIKLTLPPDAEYTTKLQILLATGDGPDIITTTSLTPKLLEQGRLMDMTDLVKSDPVLLDGKQFLQAGWDIYKFGTGKIYGVYSGADTHLLYYNKDLFDKAGVKPPAPEWTWDNFLDAAKNLTVQEGGKTTQWGTALSILVASWGWAPLVWDEGGDIVDGRPFYTKLTLNNDPVIKVLRFIQDMVHKDKVAPSPAQSQTLGEQAGFESGKVAMVLDGGWSIQSRKAITAFKWDIEIPPKGPQGQWSAFWPGTPFQVRANTKNPELAWEFVRWFAASKEAQELIAKQLIQVPARLDVATSPTFLQQPGLPPNAKAWTEALKNSKPGDTIHVKQQEMTDKVWQPNWDKFIENKMKPEEFAQVVEEEGNKILSSK